MSTIPSPSNTPDISKEYTNALHVMEAQQPTLTVSSDYSTTNNINTEVCCLKMFSALFITLILCPFAIGDVYYASRSDTCLTQNQTAHHLTIILQSYLLASGIIMFIFIGGINLIIFTYNIQDENEWQWDVCGYANITNYCVRSFYIAWLILGCVLFWGYTDISQCDQSISDYLFARFIIGIVGVVGMSCMQNQSANNMNRL